MYRSDLMFRWANAMAKRSIHLLSQYNSSWIAAVANTHINLMCFLIKWYIYYIVLTLMKKAKTMSPFSFLLLSSKSFIYKQNIIYHSRQQIKRSLACFHFSKKSSFLFNLFSLFFLLLSLRSLCVCNFYYFYIFTYCYNNWHRYGLLEYLDHSNGYPMIVWSRAILTRWPNHGFLVGFGHCIVHVLTAIYTPYY